jgi:hypothetical protein
MFSSQTVRIFYRFPYFQKSDRKWNGKCLEWFAVIFQFRSVVDFRGHKSQITYTLFIKHRNINYEFYNSGDSTIFARGHRAL